MPNLKVKVAGSVVAGGLALGLAPSAPAFAETKQAPAKTPAVTAAAVQGCGIKAYKPLKKPIRGKVRAANCGGWSVQYGLMVHRWHGWTTIKKKSWFAGKTGTKYYYPKACKMGTFSYKSWISANGGFPRHVKTVKSATARYDKKTCKN
ncbi:hypothetical protein ACFVH6_41755 [Spirillospora sp. NPDC127200]